MLKSFSLPIEKFLTTLDKYLIKEFKHKNRMDLILNTLDKNIYKDHGQESDSIIINH